MISNSALVFFLVFFTNSLANKSPESDCPKIVTRKEWGARSPEQIQYIIRPVTNVIIHHTVTPECKTESACISRIFNIQSYHMTEMHFDDISYNFLIGADGQVYEGTGWHKIGTHTKGYNDKSIGISFIGTYEDDFPNSAAVRAAKNLLQCGVSLGELISNYKLFGARQVINTISPGLKLYREIQTWPNWIKSPN